MFSWSEFRVHEEFEDKPRTNDYRGDDRLVQSTGSGLSSLSKILPHVFPYLCSSPCKTTVTTWEEDSP